MQNKMLVVKFADVALPKLSENKSKGYVNFGDDNKYPNMLLEMFNKSSKHNGIVLGKVNYIIGQGFDTQEKANKYETLNDLLKKVALDIEVFGGFYLEIKYNALGEIAGMFHVPFHKVRTNKDNTQFWVKDWTSYKSEDCTPLPAYNPQEWAVNTSQILFYKEYRPGVETYTLPGYMGALNAIKTDIEISKYHLSTITNGMFSSKMISFYEGIPTDDEKKEIEKMFKSKFAGAENAGNFILNFGKDPNKKPVVEDLSSTELDKHFDIVSKSVQQEIFVGHQVTSPMLFGIRVEGQLGGRSEMRDAYEIFKNTYINDKQQNLERLFSELTGQELKIVPVEPIGFEFTEQTLVSIAPKQWLLEKAGIDPTLYPELQQPVPGEVPGGPVNENLKNLTGRQWQNVSRIIRNYEKGKITQEQAKLLLQSSLGLTEEECNTMLSIDNEIEFSSQEQDEMLLQEFAKVGEPKSGYMIVKQRKAFSFAENEPTTLETDVLDLIKKDKRVTPEVIAEALEIEVSSARTIIDKLEEAGRITSKAVRVGEDVVIERVLTEPLSQQTKKKPTTLDFKIMYSYEVKDGYGDAVIDTTRDFCRRLIKLDKFYSRSDIEQMSRRLGYSVWDRKGGWYTESNGKRSKECRHQWKTNLVIKKK